MHAHVVEDNPNGLKIVHESIMLDTGNAMAFLKDPLLVGHLRKGYFR